MSKCSSEITECEVDDTPVVEEVIGKVEDVPPGSKKMFEVHGRKILVINDNNKLFAINGLCSHYNYSLENGVYANGRIRCPLHGACFNVKNGDIEDYPAFDNLHAFQVTDVDGDIVIKTTEKTLESDRRVKFLPKVKKLNERPVVVVGGGIAAATFIEHSRLNGLQSPIVVISEESITPYDRVVLSKNPSATGERLKLRQDDFYEHRNVKFILNTSATETNVSRREIRLSNGETLNYSKLIVASGGNVRKLTCPGSDLDNIHYVKRFEEANLISEKYTDKRVVVIGGSFIGMEMASAIAAKVQSVTVVSNTPEPFPVFGLDVGKGLRKKFEDKGVKFELGKTVVSLNGEEGKVTSVTLENGTKLDADLVIVGIGLTPATDFLKNSGVSLDKQGFILVDDKFRTNVDYIYAIGDVTSAPLSLWNIKNVNIQHFQTAQLHGKYLGYSIVGKPQPAPIVPFFWALFFFAFGFRFTGYSGGATNEYTAGDAESGNYVRYFLKNDKVVAVSGGGPMSVAVVEFEEIFQQGIVVTLDDLKRNPENKWTHLLLKN